MLERDVRRVFISQYNALIPEDVLEAMELIERAGGEAYIVGGAVRDILMGIEPLDYDIATSLRPEQVLELFSEHGWITVPKGIEYGVVSVVHSATRREIEIATFRREFYPLDYSRRNVLVDYSENIEEDLARRDFTINAMAMSPSGEIVDIYGGRQDIERGIIRFVGEPYERIREDPLRMLRAVRFASKYGFQLEPETLEAIQENAHLLRHISRERVGQEVVKAMKGVNPELFPVYLYESNLYRYVLPHWKQMTETRHDYRYTHRGESVAEHTVEVMNRIKQYADWKLRLASMLHDIGKPWTMEVREGKIMFPEHHTVGSRIVEGLVKYYWRLPAETARYTAYITRYHMEPLAMYQSLPTKRLASKLLARHREYAEDLAIHAYADTGEEYWLDIRDIIRKELSKPKPLLNGRDIMRIYNIPPGPRVGELKRKLYEIQLLEGTRTKEEIIKKACEKYGICPNRH